MEQHGMHYNLPFKQTAMYKKNFVFFAACLGMLLFGISLITLGSMATNLQQKFNLDGIASGTLFSILPIGILTGSIFFGPVCDRYGYKKLLILACLAMFAGFQGIAYSSTLGLLKISIYFIGISGGVINGATNAVVADISEKNKGANLSILGVFFGLGALGMPLLLGALAGTLLPFQVVAMVGWLTLAVVTFYLFTIFPPAKKRTVETGKKWNLFLTPFLILVSFFLFCQSSLEAIINNWTTTYLTQRTDFTESFALYALSLHIVGMIVMRLLIGTVFRQVSNITLMWNCLLLLLLGIILMQFGTRSTIVISGLILSGAGLAGGFPIMLGFVGERFKELSGTAFSFVFTIALIGNMLINYLMGLVVHTYGVSHLTTVSYTIIIIMCILCFFIFKIIKNKSIKIKNYVSKAMAE